MAAFRISRHVRHVEINGRVVVLDFRSAAYLAFDPVASTMWRHILVADSRQETLAALGRQYEVERSRLEHDYDAFVQQCLDLRLVIEADARDDDGAPQSLPALPCEKSRRPLSVCAWWSLWRTSRCLSKTGFSNTYQQMAQQACRRTTDDDDQRRLDLGIKMFARAENFFYLKRAPRDCLPRSLALFGFLRSLGLRVEHRIGVQLFPFLAHAWVQHGDRVLHDDAYIPRRFTTIASIPA